MMGLEAKRLAWDVGVGWTGRVLLSLGPRRRVVPGRRDRVARLFDVGAHRYRGVLEPVSP